MLGVNKAQQKWLFGEDSDSPDGALIFPTSLESIRQQALCWWRKTFIDSVLRCSYLTRAKWGENLFRLFLSTLAFVPFFSIVISSNEIFHENHWTGRQSTAEEWVSEWEGKRNIKMFFFRRQKRRNSSFLLFYLFYLLWEHQDTVVNVKKVRTTVIERKGRKIKK